MLQLNPVKERLMFLSPTVQTAKEREPNMNDFIIHEALGKGAFGEVYLAEHKSSKVKYAMKKISKQLIKRHKMVNQMKTEVKIMYRLFHPNIVKILNHFEEDEYIYLILEYAQGGQLYSLMKDKGKFDEKTVQQYIREMVSALEYCHTRNPPIIHRDIKPENILLDSEGHIKLADFGWSNFSDPNMRRNTFCGTLHYMAPEMIEETGHDMSLDYWSLGVLAYELLTGRAPFEPSNTGASLVPAFVQNQILENIVKGKIEFPNDFPSLAKDMISGVLKKDPKQRSTIKQLREHLWLVLPGEKAVPKSPKSQKNNFMAGLLESGKTTEGNVQIELSGDGWTDVELSELSAKPQRIMIKPEDERSPRLKEIAQNKADEFVDRSEALKLEETIIAQKSEINELNAKLKLKDEELEDLKKEQVKVEAIVDGKASENKKIHALEEENKRLKREIDDIWQMLEQKETELQRKNLEVKKLDEVKALAEKYKNKKDSLTKELKEVQGRLSETNTKIIELQKEKEDEKNKFEKIMKDGECSSPVRTPTHSDNRLLKELMEYARTSVEEMQGKIISYKGDQDTLDKLKKELNEKNIKIVKIQSECEEKLNETRRRLEFVYEEKIAKMKEIYKIELDKAEDRNREVIRSLEEQLKAYKTVQFEKEKAEDLIEQYKTELISIKTTNETLRGIFANMEKLNESNQKTILQLKQENEELKFKNSQMSKLDGSPKKNKK